ncbi:MAG TPA: D-alanyl-D-alanine carboxypeptidase [Actinomycetota bacterium]|nr:D-alanyl-D-alanine carboxypeptidase [Actinomycetota bacterium]
MDSRQRRTLRLGAVSLLAALSFAAGLIGTTPAATAEAPAAVTFSLATTWTVPGRCVEATVTVTPDKAGQTVTIQHLVSGSWIPLTSATLDGDSALSVPLCFGWAWMGTFPLRASWPTDGVSAGATSPPRSLTIRRAIWMRSIDAAAAGRSMSVTVADDGMFVYRRADTIPRAPASNEKLLLSMAALKDLGPDRQIVTRAAAPSVTDNVVDGNLWILGGGDPAVTTARIDTLADHVKAAGISAISGRVMGSLGYFSHGWWAYGWKADFPRDEVALPTALAFNGNAVQGVHIRNPEYRAAVALTARLRAIGVHVAGKPGASWPGVPLQTVATISSAPISELLRWIDVPSWNFGAETLGKLLGAVRYGAPGTIAKGAAAIRAFVTAHRVRDSAYDSSGLSYADRITTLGMVRLLIDSESSPWITSLRAALPLPGQGTLTGRLAGLRVRAKTGTLAYESALSGWVWVNSEERWAEFSILSTGYTPVLKHIEDRIVRLIATHPA